MGNETFFCDVAHPHALPRLYHSCTCALLLLLVGTPYYYQSCFYFCTVSQPVPLIPLSVILIGGRGHLNPTYYNRGAPSHPSCPHALALASAVASTAMTTLVTCTLAPLTPSCSCLKHLKTHPPPCPGMSPRSCLVTVRAT